MSLLTFILVGIVSGFLAGKVMKGRGFGLVGDLIVGVIGALVGSWVFEVMGLSAYGFIANVIMAFLGAVLFLGLVGVLKKA